MKKKNITVMAGILFLSVLFVQDSYCNEKDGTSIFKTVRQLEEGVEDPGFEAYVDGVKTDYVPPSEYQEAKEPYKIYAGDMLEISVAGSEWMKGPGPDIRVTGRGSIWMPVLGEVKLAGLTVNEAIKKLDDMLLDGYLTDPQVHIKLIERTASARYRTFSITGAVAQPWIYPAQGTVRLIDTINLAGGLTEDADTSRVKVKRSENGKKLEFIMDLYKHGLDFNIRSRDRIIVESYGKFVIYGQVMQPGTYFVSKDLTVSEAILRAGGFTDIADGYVIIKRETKDGKERRRKVQVGVILKLGDRTHDVLLEEGDVVVVPKCFF